MNTALKGESHKTAERLLHDHKLADNYKNIREKNRFYNFYQHVWINEMLKMLDTPPRLFLDYCCGTSVCLPYLREKFKDSKYIGVDLSQKMLEAGKEKYRGTPFISFCADAEELTFKNGVFDAVFSKGAIHHLPDTSKALREISRVLKPGGVFILSEPTSNIAVKGLRKILYRLSGNFSHAHKAFTSREIKRLLEKEGFKICKSKEFGMLAAVFAFPDIIPAAKVFPFPFLKLLVRLDNLMMRIPVLRCFCFTNLILVKKAG